MILRERFITSACIKADILFPVTKDFDSNDEVIWPISVPSLLSSLIELFISNPRIEKSSAFPLEP